MTIPITDRSTTLAQDVRDMLIAELPTIGRLNGNITLIEAVPDEEMGDQIMMTVRPIDFQADCVKFEVKIRIDAIVREPQNMAAITAGAEMQLS